MVDRLQVPADLEEKLSVALTRRRFIAGTLSIGLGATLLAACDDEDTDDSDPGTTGDTDEDPDEVDTMDDEGSEDDDGTSSEFHDDTLSPEQRETMTFLVPNFPQASWPYLRGAPVGGVTLYWTVWEGLYQTDSSEPIEFEPTLATSVEASEDGITFEFDLRDDVTFHNGDLMTAEDVAWSINTFRMGVYSWYSRSFGDGEAEVVDEFTVRIHNEEPDFTLVNNLAWQGWILPKNYWEEVGGEDGFAAAPIGTGPYRLAEYVPDDYLVMEAYDDHWRGEEPYFKTIIMRFVPEPATQIVMLQTGEADVVWGAIPRTFEQVRNEEGFKGIVVPGGRISCYKINQAQITHWGMDDPLLVPWGDKRVRQAANYAINRQELAEELWLGHVEPVPASIATSVLSPADGMEPYPFDPDRARELLAEAGYPDGFDTVMYTRASGGYVLHQDMDQIIASYLIDVGIRVDLQPLELGALTERSDNVATQLHPLSQLRRGATVRHPSTVGLDISCPTSPDDTASWFCHDDINQRLVDGRNIQDVEEMYEHYRELDRDIRDEAPWIFLWEDPDYFLMREDIDWHIVAGTNYRHQIWTARRL